MGYESLHIMQLFSVQCRGVARGGAQGTRAPPLSCHAMMSYERCLAIHVVTLASCKLKFTLLELVVQGHTHHRALRARAPPFVF